MNEAHAGSRIPTLMSTHPSPSDRVKQFEKWMPEAEQIRNNADCESVHALWETVAQVVKSRW
jgi:predicted Zn-dependent protease